PTVSLSSRKRRFCLVSRTTQDGAELLRDSWWATWRRPVARLADAETPRSRFAPCRNAAVMPSSREKMTMTVRSSRSVTPAREALVTRTNVVPRARLAVLPHAAELELVGVRKGLGRGIHLGADRHLFAVRREAVLLHRRLGTGEVLVVHVDEDVAKLVDPF